ncbi:MAG TPA: restriction endonuclease subunit S [Thermoanaerobaculia bacterium]|nr:restriction endonuclease subunit S [Thermoanaerobaculia bacterium]
MRAPLARVGDLAEQIRGVTYAKGDASDEPRDGYVPILRAGNISDEGLSLSDLVFVPAARVSDRQFLKRNDVLVAASSGSLDVVGKAALVNSDVKAGFGAFCKVLRPGERVHPAYFAHFFKTPAYRGRVSALAAGANINNLRNEDLDDLTLPLPSAEEQHRIAGVLDRAEALRAKRRAALAQSDGLTQAIFLEMFGDPVSNPLKWPEHEMEALIDGGPQNGLYKPASEYGSGVPILRIDAFYDGVVTDLHSLKRVRITEPELALYALRTGDIVVNRVNSIEYLGKSALIPLLPEPIVFESNMMRISLRRDLVDSRWVIEFLQSPFIRGQLLNRAKRAVNQASVNQQDVKSLRLLAPPLHLQRSFAARAAAVDGLKSSHRASLAQLDALFASLQHRAFRGEV